MARQLHRLPQSLSSQFLPNKWNEMDADPQGLNPASNASHTEENMMTLKLKTTLVFAGSAQGLAESGT